ncbi:hypothetical protein [Nitrolancea hollandica]|uniref:Uncharacterized protein n=1 Tax=Nitrolancea hollandica Lb TaxID=1129897 RepID=I4EMF8_9BACT|nr:hypothetical protein [Nitrolancea hollandica]CCF85871.1 hypothetical protein NITHO_60005 [Nitrolancea hollandica Lb]
MIGELYFEGWNGRAYLATLVDEGSEKLEVAILRGVSTERIVAEFRERTSDRLNRGILVAYAEEMLAKHVEGASFGSGHFWRRIAPILQLLDVDRRRVADCLDAHGIGDWWSASFAIAEQLPLGWEWSQRFDIAHEVAIASSRLDEYSTWWITPERLPVTLDARTVRSGQPWLLDYYQSRPVVGSTPLDFGNAKPPVYEIASARDWAEFVDSYPYAAKSFRTYDWGYPGSAGLVIPDWAKVAKDWDGVHVSVSGYPSAAYRPLPIRHGWTVLAGWHPGATVWLRWP